MRGRPNRSWASDQTGSSYGQRRLAENASSPRTTPSTPVYLEQVRMLYDAAPTALLANLANASILTYLLWDAVDRSLLQAWMTVTVLLQIGRFELTRGYRKSTRQPDRSTAIGRIPEATRWDRWYLAGVAASGLMWGVAGTALFPHDSPSHQMALIFVLGGMAAGGTAVLSSVRTAYPLFALPALLPLATSFFLKGDAHSTAMGVLSLIYLAVLLNVARLIHGTITSSITLRFGNKALVADLQARTNELSQVNQLLRTEIDQRAGIQDRLQEQLFFQQELMDAIPNPLFHTDTKGAYLGCNKAFEKLAGRSRADIIGRTAFDILPKELANALTRMDHELFERGYFRARQVEFHAADGTARRVITHRALHHNPLGKVIGMIGLLADVTDRRTVFRRSRPEEDAGRPARSR